MELSLAKVLKLLSESREWLILATVVIDIVKDRDPAEAPGYVCKHVSEPIVCPDTGS